MAGAALLEWNLQASSPGAAALWGESTSTCSTFKIKELTYLTSLDCQFRVGGALGSGPQVGDCPKLTGNVNKNRIAAKTLFHLTPFGSGYFESILGWVTDHDMDTAAQTQVDIYVARGALVESIGNSLDVRYSHGAFSPIPVCTVRSSQPLYGNDLDRVATLSNIATRPRTIRKRGRTIQQRPYIWRLQCYDGDMCSIMGSPLWYLKMSISMVLVSTVGLGTTTGPFIIHWLSR